MWCATQLATTTARMKPGKNWMPCVPSTMSTTSEMADLHRAQTHSGTRILLVVLGTQAHRPLVAHEDPAPLHVRAPEDAA